MQLGVGAVALAAGIAIGAAVAVHERRGAAAPASSGAELPIETWAAGSRPAPAFSLLDQAGRPVSLAALRGRPVIVTFLDPLCRNFCPREATVISQAVRSLPNDHVAVVAVSVDPWGDTSTSFHEDALHWGLAPGWTWGIASRAALAAVWRNYEVGVSVTTRRLAGVSIHEITHTAATYLVDPAGDIRSLLLYPFDAGALRGAIRTMLTTTT